MKILVVCQHYWPEQFPLTDICEGLAELGHQVHVITDVPNYPMGYIFPEYKGGKNREQEHNGVRITRTFTIGRRNNIIFRMLNYFSYAVSSTIHALGMKEDYDVVFANQSSPVLMVSAALAYAKKRKKKAVMYCMDLWPASLVMGGVQESSPIFKVFHAISGFLYRRADRILVTSQMFREYFDREFGISGERIGYLAQYAAAHFDELPPAPKKETVDFMFAGNVGTAQTIPTILQAAKLLADRPELRWHIVGDGSELENSRLLAQQLGLDNVIFHGRKPVEQMPEYYAMADAMLVTLTADPAVSLTLPAKVQTYMAAGKPILAAANGEIANVVAESGCGFCAKAEDAEGLAQAALQFLDCQDKRELGNRAKEYYRDHFTREIFMKKLVEELEGFCVSV